MKAFYTVRTEDHFGQPTFEVWDYYMTQPVCAINDKLSNRRAEYYADKIAKALNEMMHPEKPHERS